MFSNCEATAVARKGNRSSIKAGALPRFGYRRLYIFLRWKKAEDGTPRWTMNHKRVYRLYRDEGLAMRNKKRKRFRAEERVASSSCVSSMVHTSLVRVGSTKGSGRSSILAPRRTPWLNCGKSFLFLTRS